MKLALPASFATALTVLCIDARADVNRNCITTLEVQPVSAPQKPGADAKKPCPVAVTFTRRAPVAGSPTARSLSDTGVRA